MTFAISDLFEHLSTLFGNTNETEFSPPDTEDIVDPELDSDFDESEVKEAVFSQKNNKSAGIDTIVSEMLKTSYDIISPFLLSLFNKMFNNAEYPISWGDGIICPIYKSGNPNEAKNYRGITLINILGKIYSQLLLNRITKWVEKHDTLNKNQFGFQKGKSTVDCIFLLHSIITKVLGERKKLYCAFIDFEKAFDKIDRHMLWYKLHAENISSKIIKAMKSMYNTVKSCIRHKDKLSNTFDSYLGLKQGDPSSPLMFMMFINDLENNINSDLEGIFTIEELKIFMIFYADDSAVFASSPESLQSILSELESYCNTWGLKINTSKTKIMIFERGRPTHKTFTLNDKKIEIVTSFKYLGIYLHKNGNWLRTQQHIAQHASKAYHNLCNILNQIQLKTSDKCKLFDVLVSSVLNYCSEIWGYHEGKEIERLHTKFCRKILGVKKSTNLLGLYGELGRVPLKINRQLNMIKYWIKILSMDDTSPVKKIYLELKHDTDANTSNQGLNWASKIKHILNSTGFSNVWINQNEPISHYFVLIKNRIYDQFYQHWNEGINSSNRLLSYCQHKTSFEFENYLDFIKENKFRIALSRFRLSSHNLSIETGRYNNIQRDERICPHCNNNQIENEYHFLLVCPFFREIRKQFLKPYFCRWPNVNKYQQLMLTTSKRITISLSKYLYFASKHKTNQTV